MKTSELNKAQGSVPVSSSPKSSKFSSSCKFLCCAIFVIGALLNLLLTTILLLGVENYHKADTVKLYEVFQTPKYAQTNHILDTTQYLVLYGETQSGIINFVQHEANLRSIEGQPVVMREIEENVIHKHMKESRHFVEMYLGQVPRGHHSWFILLKNSETPILEIEAIKKKYPKDSIVLVAHQQINVQGFVNHKFPTLKAKELKEFLQKDLEVEGQEVKQILESAATKDAPAIFQSYKSFQQAKARAIEEAERLKKLQEQQKERLRLEQEARKAAEQQALEETKKLKKDKKASKGKKNKETKEQEQPTSQQPVKEQQQIPKKKKSSKKDKTRTEQKQQVTEQAKEQQPKESKKKDKKSSKKQSKKSKVEEQLESTLEEELAAKASVDAVVNEESNRQAKKGKNKKNKNKQAKIQSNVQDSPQEQQTLPVQEATPVQAQVKPEQPEETAKVAIQETNQQPDVKQNKKSKGKGKDKKKVDSQKQVKKGKKSNKKSSQTPQPEQPTEQTPSSTEQGSTAQTPQEPVVTEAESTQ